MRSNRLLRAAMIAALAGALPGAVHAQDAGTFPTQPVIRDPG